MWTFANPDWVAALKGGYSLLPDLPLDETEAKRAIGIFNKLHLPDVPGQPQMVEAAGDWFRDIVAALFGSLDDAGVRRVQELFALVPKKNSKTTGGAGIMITALLMNERPRAEFLLVGPTQEIADLALQQCIGMIDADTYLQKRFQVQEHKKAIIDRFNKSTLKIKTFDMKVMTGAKPVGVLVDEVHILSKIRGAANVIGQIRGGFLPRPEGFLLMITTQSDEPPAGVFKKELDFARAVRDGRITGEAATVLPLLYEFPEEMQTGQKKLPNGKVIKLPENQTWRNMEHWPLVTPNLGLSITEDGLRKLFFKAEAKGEEELRRFASQHLNVQIGLGLHSDRWRGADYWESAADSSITLETLIERCEVIVGGIDGGGLDDLLGLTLIGRCRDTRDWLTWSRAWVARSLLDLRPEIASQLEDYNRDGDLIFIEDAVQDIREVADCVEQVLDAGLLPDEAALGLDPVGVTAIVDELQLRGVDEKQAVAVPQGYRLTGAIHSTERALKDGTMWHADQALMAFCVSNAKAEQRGNATLITKETAGRAKIDPLVALFNAAQLMGRNPLVASTVSLYATESVLVV
ncbi:MAG: terminase large subunit [Pseudomonadota bacterium]